MDDAFDMAILLSNDSGFVQPVHIVRERFGKDVIVVSPDHQVSRGLDRVATASRRLDRGLLARCQLPNPIVAAGGATITRPYEWDPAQRRRRPDRRSTSLARVGTSIDHHSGGADR